MKDEAYLAWRESESYQVPMTAEGEEKAQQRWLNFRKGWNAAIRECVKTCDTTNERFAIPFEAVNRCKNNIQELES